MESQRLGRGNSKSSFKNQQAEKPERKREKKDKRKDDKASSPSGKLIGPLRAEKLSEHKKANKIARKSESGRSKEVKPVESAMIEAEKLCSSRPEFLMESSERARLAS